MNKPVPAYQFRAEGTPEAHGLYDPRNEHDACGIGLLANINNIKSHRVVKDALGILKNLEHRGAVGADSIEHPLPRSDAWCWFLDASSALALSTERATPDVHHDRRDPVRPRSVRGLGLLGFGLTRRRAN